MNLRNAILNSFDQGINTNLHDGDFLNFPLLRIFPNPTEGIVNIDLSQISNREGCKIEIISMDGKTVRSITINNSDELMQLSVSDLAIGIFQIRLNTPAKCYYEKLIIVK